MFASRASSDGTCSFTHAGDMNNTNPMLGPLQNGGGPTQTMALPSGSPAVDAGNPNGCTDGFGRLLKTDQRGKRVRTLRVLPAATSARSSATATNKQQRCGTKARTL
jgi:hypothetical protein